jgi:tetratricopeptide (TPR) repeat protein
MTFEISPVIELSSPNDKGVVRLKDGHKELNSGLHHRHCRVGSKEVRASIRFIGPRASGMGMGAGFVKIERLFIDKTPIIADPITFNWFEGLSKEPVLIGVTLRAQGAKVSVEKCTANNWNWGVGYSEVKCAREWHEANKQPGTSFEEGKAAYERGDYATALRELLPLAERGDAKAQSKLSEVYYMLSNEAESRKWELKAAQNGDVRAQFSIGYTYYTGRRHVEAVKWFRKAAEQGHVIAQERLGFAYLNALGVPQDGVEAVKWFSKAAAFAGEIKTYCSFCASADMARLVLGHIYADGARGVPQNYVLAHMWYNVATATNMSKEGAVETAERRDNLAKRMTPAQIAEAQKLAREWWAAYQKRKAK